MSASHGLKSPTDNLHDLNKNLILGTVYMRKCYVICWSIVLIHLATACSFGKNKRENSVLQHHEREPSGISDVSTLPFLEVKMDELVSHAKEKNPRFPFAAMIIETNSGKEICRGINTSSVNPIWHGEIDAINNCVNAYGRDKIDWPNLTLITTAEPCPMCQGAIIWTGIRRVVYGTSIQHLIEKGWRQIAVNSEELSARSNFNKPEVIGGVLAEKTNPLFIDIRE